MEKKIWVRPEMNTVAFESNEYVASCWNIRCNVEQGTGYYETNGQDGYQLGTWVNGHFENGQWIAGHFEGGDEYIASGNGCGTVHTAHGIDAAGPSANAWWQESATGKFYEVFHFFARVNGKKSDHFCTLDSVNWEKNPNASN